MIMNKQSGVSNIIYGLLVIAILSSAIFGLTRLESTFDDTLYDIKSQVSSVSPSISNGTTLIKDCQLVISHDGAPLTIDDTLCPIPKTAFEELAAEISFANTNFSKIRVEGGECGNESGYHSLQIDGLAQSVDTYATPVTTGQILNGYVDLTLADANGFFSINLGSEAFKTITETEVFPIITDSIAELSGALMQQNNYFTISLSADNFSNLSQNSVCISWPNSNTSESIVYYHYTLISGAESLTESYLNDFDVDETAVATYATDFVSGVATIYPTFIDPSSNTAFCQNTFPNAHTHQFSLTAGAISDFENDMQEGTADCNDQFPENEMDYQNCVNLISYDRSFASGWITSYFSVSFVNSLITAKFHYGDPDQQIVIYPYTLVCSVSSDVPASNITSFHSQNAYGLEGIVDGFNQTIKDAIEGVNSAASETVLEAYIDGAPSLAEPADTDELNEYKAVFEAFDVNTLDETARKLSMIEDTLSNNYNGLSEYDSFTVEDGSINENLNLIANNMGKYEIIEGLIGDAENESCEIEFAADSVSGDMGLSNNPGSTDPDSPVCQYPNDAFAEGHDDNGYIQLSSSNSTCDFLEDNSHRIQIVEFSNITSESTTSFSGENITVTAEKLNADTLQITITGAAVTYGSDQYASGSTIDFTMSADPADDDLCIYWSNEEWQQ